MFCANCGQQISDNAVTCFHCGCQTGNSVNNNANIQKSTVVSDSSSFGWSLLGFFVPIVGIILWLVWRKETPLKAKSAGMGALISIILSIIFAIITVVILFIFGFAALGFAGSMSNEIPTGGYYYYY